jgi:ankyrin repeat protein
MCRFGAHPLLEAVRQNAPNQVDTLLVKDGKTYPTELLQKCLWTACHRGSFENATLLIDHGADYMQVNMYYKTMLMAAVAPDYADEPERLKLVQLLCEVGVNLQERDCDNKCVLQFAAQFNRPTIVQWLAPFFGERDYSEALMLAVAENHLTVARQLIKLGGDVNFNSSNGVRPVVVATCKQHFEMVALLVYSGANINTPVNTGAHAIHFAARLGIPILTMVLQKGGNVFARTNQKNTALHYAVEALRIDNVRALLDAGSDVNAANDIGRTPLLLACYLHNYAMVEMLLQRGADPNQCDSKLSFPLNNLVLSSFYSFHVFDLLVRYGARLNQPKGNHPLVLYCMRNPEAPFAMVEQFILRGTRVPLNLWFDRITYPPTILKLGVWAMMHERAAKAYLCAFVLGEERGVRPVPVVRRLTGAYGLYPIRRRLASFLVHRQSVRSVIRSIVQQY